MKETQNPKQAKNPKLEIEVLNIWILSLFGI
jgi:hypothetical protein